MASEKLINDDILIGSKLKTIMIYLTKGRKKERNSDHLNKSFNKFEAWPWQQVRDIRQAAQTYSSQLDFSTTVMEPSEAAVTANLRFYLGEGGFWQVWKTVLPKSYSPSNVSFLQLVSKAFYGTLYRAWSHQNNFVSDIIVPRYGGEEDFGR